MVIQDKIRQLDPLCRTTSIGKTALEINADCLAINACSIYKLLTGAGGSLGNSAEALATIADSSMEVCKAIKKAAEEAKQIADARAA